MQRQGCNQKSEVHQKITSRSLCAPYNLSFSVLMYFICFGTVMAEHTWMGIHLLLPCPFSTWRPGEKHCHIIAAKWILIHTWSALSNFNYLSKFCKKCVFKMFFFFMSDKLSQISYLYHSSGVGLKLWRAPNRTKCWWLHNVSLKMDVTLWSDPLTGIRNKW